MEKVKEFISENLLAILIGLCLLLLICWLHHDANRNKPVYNDTDKSMERIEERISAIEQRIDTMSNRLEKAEKTVSGTIVTIRDSRENAVTVADGITGTESRLNDAVQRSGRIQNLISDIETANHKGKKNP